MIVPPPSWSSRPSASGYPRPRAGRSQAQPSGSRTRRATTPPCWPARTSRTRALAAAEATGITLSAVPTGRARRSARLILACLALYWRRLPLLRRGYEPGPGCRPDPALPERRGQRLRDLDRRRPGRPGRRPGHHPEVTSPRAWLGRGPHGSWGTMFEGFRLERIDVGDAELRVRRGGSGPAVPLPSRPPAYPRRPGTWSLPAGRAVHRRMPGPARLRGVVEAADDARPPALLQAGHGRRLHRADGLARVPPAGRRRARPRGQYVAQRLAMDHPARCAACA